MERWSKKVAVVTGASAGIGAGILTTLAEYGIITVGLARRSEMIEHLATKTKGKIYSIRCDVTREEEVIRAFKWIDENLGGIDLLINSAGVTTVGPLSDDDSTKWKNIFDVNVIALSLCTREALKIMKKKDQGHIIHMNSIVGHWMPHFGNVGIYSASKHAVTALAEALRIELFNANSKILITSMSPGLVHTELGSDVVKKLFKIDFPKLDEPRPETILAVQDVSDAVIAVLSLKPHIQVQEFTFQCIGKAY